MIEPRFGTDDFDRLLTECLDSNELAVIIARRPCILIAKQLKQYEEQGCECPASFVNTGKDAGASVRQGSPAPLSQ